MAYKHYTDVLRKIKKLLDVIDSDYKDTSYIQREKRTLQKMFIEVQRTKSTTEEQEKILNNIKLTPRLEGQCLLFDVHCNTINMFND